MDKPLVLAINPRTGDAMTVTDAQDAKDHVADGWGLIVVIGKGVIEAEIDADIERRSRNP